MSLAELPDSPVSMVDRVVVIFDVFERSGGRLRLGQIAARTRLPRSSVHRILQQLVDARWLYRAGTEYALGLRVFELGSLVAHRSRLSSVAQPLLHELSSTGSRVAHLAILDGHDVVYLEKIGGALAAKLPSRVGGRMPAHCTAVGKALLAFSEAEVMEDYLRADLKGRTSVSIKSHDHLRAEIATVRIKGYATETEESLPGIACVAAPIRESGTASAAISVCLPSERFNLAEVKHSVMWTGAEISRRLAFAPRPGARRHLVSMS